MERDATINFSELVRLGTVVPDLYSALERIQKKLDDLTSAKPQTVAASSDPWLTAEQAREHLGRMSKGTFDKYRYQTTPRLTGHPLDGKILYKQSELDNFVRLYGAKSSGFA